MRLFAIHTERSNYFIFTMLSVDICDDFSAVEDYASTESTGPVGGTITIASGNEYLLKQFKEPALVSLKVWIYICSDNVRHVHDKHSSYARTITQSKHVRLTIPIADMFLDANISVPKGLMLKIEKNIFLLWVESVHCNVCSLVKSTVSRCTRCQSF